MDLQLLIDNIVRQTTLLIAQLATTAGHRTPLNHVAGQVFLELVKELKAQGLGNKVIADMFGLALRTYHDRVRRLSESATCRGVSLWEAVLSYVRERGLVNRAAVLRRFHADDEAVVRGVLADLVDSGLLFRSGRSDATTFRAADLDELGQASEHAPELAMSPLLWVILHQRGPMSVTELAEASGVEQEQVRGVLSKLVDDGQVRWDEARARYSAAECVIPFGAEHGWEAALFDHFQAMVAAMVHKLSTGNTRAAADELVGGSTYHFDLFPGHPEEEAVAQLLAEVRERATALRLRVAEGPSPADPSASYRVVFYAGQNVISATPTDDSEHANSNQPKLGEDQ